MIKKVTLLIITLVLSACSSTLKKSDVVSILKDNGYSLIVGGNYECNQGEIYRIGNLTYEMNYDVNLEMYYSEQPFVLIDTGAKYYMYLLDDDLMLWTGPCNDDKGYLMYSTTIYSYEKGGMAIGEDSCKYFHEDDSDEYYLPDDLREEFNVYKQKALDELERLGLTSKDLKKLND